MEEALTTTFTYFAIAVVCGFVLVWALVRINTRKK